MTNYIKSIIIIFLFLASSLAHAQTAKKDSIQLKVKSWNIKSTFLMADSIKFDTTLAVLNNDYLSRTPNNAVNLGSEGYPVYHVFNGPQLKGVNYICHGYEPYIFDYSNTNIYQTTKPVTIVGYFNSGPKAAKYQNIRILHTQNFSDRLNTGFRFNNISSVGNYSRQETHDYNFNFWTGLKLDRYQLNGTISLNRFKNQESGGIKDETVFENEETQKDLFIPVWLENAKSVQRYREFAVLQRYFLSENDSSGLSLVHNFNYSISNRAFFDEGTDTSYYNYFGLDTIVDYDSLYYSDMSNKLALQFSQMTRIGKIGIEAGARHHSQKFYHNGGTSHNKLEIEGIAVLRNRRSDIVGEANFTMAGYNSGDFRLAGKYDLLLSDSSESHLIVSFTHENRKPDWFFHNYSFNPPDKQGSDKSQINTRASSQIILPRYKVNLGFELALLGNPVYFNGSAVPSQEIGTFAYMAGRISRSFHLRNFHFENNFMYQGVYGTDNLPIPELYYKGSIYFENDLLKKIMHFQLGVDCRVTSKFNAPGYMPLYGVYYVQNNRLIGNYPVFDIYAKVKLKTVRILLKYEHANQGMMDRNYYSAYLHPMNPSRFTWGLVWFFYD
jgi:hypothetical protein